MQKSLEVLFWNLTVFRGGHDAAHVDIRKVVVGTGLQRNSAATNGGGNERIDRKDRATADYLIADSDFVQSSLRNARVDTGQIDRDRRFASAFRPLPPLWGVWS